MSSEKRIIRLVRTPEERYDDSEIVALTRKRVLEIYPLTEERHLQHDALLVRHPYLHPRFTKKLLPANNLYTALREEAEEELFGALVRLGAIEVELEQARKDSQERRTGGSAGGGFKGIGVTVGGARSTKYEEMASRKIRLALHPRRLDLDEMDKEEFLAELVHNKDNATLEVLFDTIKSGKKPKEFRIEFSHAINRARALEVAISASYLKLFKVEVDFHSEYVRSRVDRMMLIARFEDEEQNAERERKAAAGAQRGPSKK